MKLFLLSLPKVIFSLNLFLLMLSDCAVCFFILFLCIVQFIDSLGRNFNLIRVLKLDHGKTKQSKTGSKLFFLNFVGKHEVLMIWKTKSLVRTVWVAVNIEKPNFLFLLENTGFQ